MNRTDHWSPTEENAANSNDAPLALREPVVADQQPTTDTRPGEFTFNWFDGHIPHLTRILAPYRGRPEVRMLEIGSYEGRSTVWWLENILTGDGSQLTTVDTWKGSAEHDAAEMDAVWARFQRNTARDVEEGRLTVAVTSSQAFLVARIADRVRGLHASGYHIIYVDGSHAAPDVLSDAVLSWELLEPGGVLIFDDYLWGTFSTELERPRLAIDGFLACFVGQYDELYRDYQVIIRKRDLGTQSAEQSLVQVPILAASKMPVGDAVAIPRIRETDQAPEVVARAHALRIAGKPREALAALRDAVHHAPDYGELFLLMGGVLLDLNQPREARLALREAVSLNPGSVFAHWHLGEALLLSGAFERAEAAFRTALALAPEDEYANAGMVRVLHALGRPRESVPYTEHGRHLLLANDRMNRDASPMRNEPSVLASFMPKSGGTYIAQVLNSSVSLVPFTHAVGADELNGIVIPSFLAEYVQGGCFSHTHLPASPPNIAALEEAGYTRYWVHVRDPRQVLVSLYHAMRGEGQGQGLIAEDRRRGMATQLSRIAKQNGFNDWNGVRVWLIREYYLLLRQWIIDWVETADRPGWDVLFTRFEDLKTGPHRVIASGLRHFGLETAFSLPDPGSPQNRYRRGELAEWRSFFTEEEHERLATTTILPIFEQFGWA